MEDFQLLAKELGNYKLSRVRANELNIYSCGGVASAQNHLTGFRENQKFLQGGKEVKVSLIECIRGRQNAESSTQLRLDPENPSPYAQIKPKLNYHKMAEWFNKNSSQIQSANYLKADQSYSTHQHYNSRGLMSQERLQAHSEYGPTGVLTSQQGKRTQKQINSIGPKSCLLQNQMGRNNTQSSFFQTRNHNVQQSRSSSLLYDAAQKMEFESQMHMTLNLLKKDKKMLGQVKKALTKFEEDRLQQSCKDGLEATKKARQRVRENVQSQEKKEEKDIQRLINQQTNAIHATNLERLLTKQWSEYPNAYLIMTKIGKYSKKEDRVNKLLNLNRYSP